MADFCFRALGVFTSALAGQYDKDELLKDTRVLAHYVARKATWPSADNWKADQRGGEGKGG